jgi:uncharacterized protein (DUF169 family)
MLSEISAKITSSLNLDETPVALALTDGPPAGVPTLSDAVPSACSMWRRAAAGVFYAPAESHHNCPIGTMTMGFDTEPVAADLQAVVGLMSAEGYLAEGEPARIPVIDKSANGIVYGPLGDFPIEPDLALLWLSPAQAMLVAEAVGYVQWTSPTPAQVYGRPACTALPVAMNGGHPAISFGCTGMRTFTAISGDRLLAALPGADLEHFADALVAAAATNERIQAVYDQRNLPFVAMAAG